MIVKNLKCQELSGPIRGECGGEVSVKCYHTATVINYDANGWSEARAAPPKTHLMRESPPGRTESRGDTMNEIKQYERECMEIRERLQEEEINRLNNRRDYGEQTDFDQNAPCFCGALAEVSRIKTDRGLNFTEWECWRHYWERRIMRAKWLGTRRYNQGDDNSRLLRA